MPKNKKPSKEPKEPSSINSWENFSMDLPKDVANRYEKFEKLPKIKDEANLESLLSQFRLKSKYQASLKTSSKLLEEKKITEDSPQKLFEDALEPSLIRISMKDIIAWIPIRGLSLLTIRKIVSLMKSEQHNPTTVPILCVQVAEKYIGFDGAHRAISKVLFFLCFLQEG
jgi:hypothetical protein